MNVFAPSALYTAERYTGDLPDDCAFMLELSQKLHDDPDYGKQWSEGSVGHDCLQPYRKPASQSAQDIRPAIFEFLDSRSIKEHLQRINYELTTPVAAFIVHRSHKATLQQKLEGWQKIIDNMPNCVISRRNDTFNIPDFHAFLCNVIKQEQRKLAHFKRTDGRSLYFFENYSWDQRDQGNCLYGPYSSYQKCFDAIWKELDGDDPKAIRITRRPIDPNEEHYVDDMVVLNASGEVMSCDYRFESEWDEAGTANDFEDMWFDIPTPFHAGDIVCNLQRPNKPMVLFDLQTWGSERVDKELASSVYKERLVEKADKLLRWHRYDGDTSDMYAYGCQVSSALHFPFYIGEPEGFLLDDGQRIRAAGAGGEKDTRLRGCRQLAQGPLSRAVRCDGRSLFRGRLHRSLGLRGRRLSGGDPFCYASMRCSSAHQRYHSSKLRDHAYFQVISAGGSAI